MAAGTGIEPALRPGEGPVLADRRTRRALELPQVRPSEGQVKLKALGSRKRHGKAAVESKFDYLRRRKNSVPKPSTPRATKLGSGTAVSWKLRMPPVLEAPKGRHSAGWRTQGHQTRHTG